LVTGKQFGVTGKVLSVAGRLVALKVLLGDRAIRLASYHGFIRKPVDHRPSSGMLAVDILNYAIF